MPVHIAVQRSAGGCDASGIFAQPGILQVPRYQAFPGDLKGVLVRVVVNLPFQLDAERVMLPRRVEERIGRPSAVRAAGRPPPDPAVVRLAAVIAIGAPPARGGGLARRPIPI